MQIQRVINVKDIKEQDDAEGKGISIQTNDKETKTEEEITVFKDRSRV